MHTSMHIELVQPKVEYVRKLRITCQRCGYEWLSETKASKRTSCSRCKTSITLPRQDTNRNSVPLQIKSLSELEEILDPHTSKLRKKFTAMKTESQEMWMKSYRKFVERNPDMASDLRKDIIESNRREKQILEEAKARHMTKVQTYLFSLLKRREYFNTNSGSYPKELIKLVNAEYDLLWKIGYDLYLLEKVEAIEASENDERVLKRQNQNQNRSKSEKSVRRSKP